MITLRHAPFQVAVFFVALPAALAAQDVEAWFARAPEAAAYSSVRTGLLALATSERSEILTDHPLADRLAEGARKGVPADRLLSILTEEAKGLSQAATLLKERGLLPTAAADSARLFSQLDITLRSGFSVEDFGAALDGALSKKGKKAEVPGRAVAVLSSLVGVNIEGQSRRSLIGAMAAGPLADSRLSSVKASWANLVSRNATPEQTLSSLIDSVGPRPRASAADGDGAAGPIGKASSAQAGEGLADEGKPPLGERPRPGKQPGGMPAEGMPGGGKPGGGMMGGMMGGSSPHPGTPPGRP
ncbi:MAG: hypothetical protein WCQ50_05600 [Spirochaetota bacterium]